MLYFKQYCTFSFNFGTFCAAFISLITDLGSQVVSEDAERLDLEFSDQWLLLVEAESREGRQVAGLVGKAATRLRVLHHLSLLDCFFRGLRFQRRIGKKGEKVR